MISSPAAQTVLHLRGVAGQPVEVGEFDHPFAAPVTQPHRRVQRHQGHGQVARVGGGTGVTRAEDGVAAVLAGLGRAAAAGLAFVARGVDVPEVSAAGALQQVAADAGHVADLRRRALHQRLHEHRIVGGHPLVGGDVAHPLQRADAQAVPAGVDAAQRERVDVDDVGGCHHVELHQVDQGGAAGQVCGVRGGEGGLDGARGGVARRRASAARLLDRVDDVGVRAAAADVARHPLARSLRRWWRGLP